MVMLVVVTVELVVVGSSAVVLVAEVLVAIVDGGSRGGTGVSGRGSNDGFGLCW